VNTKTSGEKRHRTLRTGFVFALILIAALFVPFVLFTEEPARILLLGAVLLGVAIWGRRRLARHTNT
jgi:hypothetical protein